MSAPAVLTLDELVLPISAASPSGEPLPDGVRLQLDELRKEPDDFDSSSAGRQADWPKVIRLATDNLKGKSKDLLLAVRLVEAVTKKHGTAGLRDGLQLLGRLAKECWDYLYPLPGVGEDAEVRVGPFNWLNDAMRGAKFPQAIRALPVVKAGQKTFAYLDWITAGRKAELEESMGKVDIPALTASYEDLTAARSALEELSRTLDEKLGNDIAPNFLTPENTASVGTAIDHCLQMVLEVGHRRGVKFGATANEGQGGEPDESNTSDLHSPSSALNGSTRESLYRQIESIAATLKRIEPHSPIPFMLERCVRLGALPFPSLMRAMIRESVTLDELDRITGIERAGEQGTMG